MRKNQVNQSMGEKPKKTLLVAEDEIINRMYLAEILKDKNYKVLEAGNGEETVEMCRKHPEIDLVLMDVKMPGLDGYGAAEKIRTFRPGLPIILQTAYTSNQEEIQKAESLFQDQIQKPIIEKTLFSLLDKYLSQDVSS